MTLLLLVLVRKPVMIHKEIPVLEMMDTSLMVPMMPLMVEPSLSRRI
jgi:hypothetical protein